MNRPFNSLIFYVSLIAAFMVYFVPLRGDILYWRPMTVFVTVIFWLLAEPHVLGVGFAWVAGLTLDLLSGGVLGQNALALSICAYLLMLVGQRLNNFSVWHQLLVIAFLSMVFLLLHAVISLLTGKAADNWHMLYTILTTLVLWPPWAILLWKFYNTE